MNSQWAFISVGWAALAVPIRAAAPTETLRVEVKVRTGGAVSGPVIDYSPHGLVVCDGSIPYVFSWREMEPTSAYTIRRALLDLKRGATDQTKPATFPRTDSDDEPDEVEDSTGSQDEVTPASSPARPAEAGLMETVDREMARIGADPALVAGPSFELSKAVDGIYRSFGKTVQEVISMNIVLIETDHFLIWTDWNAPHRDRLPQLCEAMYQALCRKWQIDPAAAVFLAKCPVFCFRAKSRFRKFARLFDGYDARNSLGYTRSIESSGHVHLVLLRLGEDEYDFDRFESTLVHEGTHAFLHRRYGTRLIPHWINEGYADWMAERLLGNRCDTGENADLLARQYVRHEWPIRRLIESSGPVDVHDYPLAQSIVGFLQAESPDGFRGLLRGLKAGQTFPAALAENYGGMTLVQLDDGWRSFVAASGSTTMKTSLHP